MITNTTYTMKETVTLTGEEIESLLVAVTSQMKSSRDAIKHFEKLDLTEMKRIESERLIALHSVYDKITAAENNLQAKYDRKWYGLPRWTP